MLHILFAVSLAIVALLYSSVGQAGGTGYVALMGLAGFAPAVIKPSAVARNILVSAMAAFASTGRVWSPGAHVTRSQSLACRSHCSAAHYIFLRGCTSRSSEACCSLHEFRCCARCPATVAKLTQRPAVYAFARGGRGIGRFVRGDGGWRRHLPDALGAGARVGRGASGRGDFGGVQPP